MTLALAFEIYYGTTTQEREALASEGIEMARRLGDPALLVTAIRMTVVAVSRPATADDRLRLVEEALEIAERGDDERALATALTLQAGLAYEIGDVAAGAAAAATGTAPGRSAAGLLRADGARHAGSPPVGHVRSACRGRRTGRPPPDIGGTLHADGVEDALGGARISCSGGAAGPRRPCPASSRWRSDQDRRCRPWWRCS